MNNSPLQPSRTFFTAILLVLTFFHLSAEARNEARVARRGNDGGYSGPQISGEAIPVNMDRLRDRARIDEALRACLLGAKGFGAKEGFQYPQSLLAQLAPQMARANGFSSLLVLRRMFSNNGLWSEDNGKTYKGGFNLNSYVTLDDRLYGFGDLNVGQVATADPSTGRFDVTIVFSTVRISLDPLKNEHGYGFGRNIPILRYTMMKNTEYDVNGNPRESMFLRNVTVVVPEVPVQSLMNYDTRRGTPYTVDFRSLATCFVNDLQR